MNCPNCKKKSVCFCGSCKARRNMPKQRSERVIQPQHLKCPYCKEVFDIDYLECLEWEEYKKINHEKSTQTNK